MNIILNFFCFFGCLVNTSDYWKYTKFREFFRKAKIEIDINTIVLFFLSIIIAKRWYDSGHFPLSNLYDSLLFLAWTIQLVLSILEILYKNKNVGIILSPTILMLFCFANYILPQNMKIPQLLVPSLQSNWLIMHVTIMIISYGFLIVGCLLSCCYMVLTFYYKKTNNMNSVSLIQIDELSSRTISAGFPLLTLGIISGAVWANETWGSFWNWDPKETWALITWFVFAIYLHTRFLKGWKGEKSVSIAIIGFFILWICFLGVNLLGKGLHSYGWWS